MINNLLYSIALLFVSFIAFPQTDSSAVLSFDFNEQQLKENNDKITISPVGVTLTNDRFGNKRSAAYIHGNASSYINMGASDLLKNENATISMWINLQCGTLSGKGYETNPIIIIKNSPGEDFIIGCGISYSYKIKRFLSQASKDSLKEVIIHAKDTVDLDSWYHLAVAYNDDDFYFYVNGELQGKFIKGFRSSFLKGDSVVIGRTTGNKNERFTNAIFDDIRFYDRVLNEEEIIALYHEPNPNRFKNMLADIFKYGIIAIAAGIIILIIMVQNKRKLRRQKEYYELNHKIKELEIKVIKTQMNPHFISNSLAAIQHLIYTNQTSKAAQYLAKFNFLLREVLNHSDKTYTSLEEELSVIRLNIELEQLRFNHFAFEVSVDDSLALSDIMIPSLITQPFIENAIWHGLLPLEGRVPRLCVRIYPRDSIVFLEIEDNGVGRANPGTPANKNSKGTKLAIDKMESTNLLRNSRDYQLEIVDIFDVHQHGCGTKIIIRLLNYNPEE